MKRFTLLLFFFCITTGFSQKSTLESYDAKDIQQLYIHLDEVFKINVTTSKTNRIGITTSAQGEYYNDISLEVEVLQERLVLTSKFREILQSGFDKLSAHKVFSMEITLEIPEGLEVYIDSNIAAVMAEGNFQNFQAQLRSGVCHLHNFSGDALVNTYSGGIVVETQNATIIASSRKGRLYIPRISLGEHKVELRSITGDIRVVIN